MLVTELRNYCVIWTMNPNPGLQSTTIPLNLHNPYKNLNHPPLECGVTCKDTLVAKTI